MNESYVSLGIHTLDAIGDGVVSLPGSVLILDNLSADATYRREAAIPFENTLMKLDFSIIILCLEGHLSYSIDFRQISVGHGDITFVRRGQIAEFHKASEDCRLALVALADEPFDLVDYHELAFEGLGTTSDTVMYHPGEELFEELLDIYRILRRKLSDPDFRFRKQAVKACVGMIVADIVNLYVETGGSGATDRPTGASERQLELYHRFIRLVKENFLQQRSIAFYAGELCVSPNYLSRVVRSAGGRSVHEWIRDYVILEAKALLASGNHPVNQVSEMLNFPNPSFFSKYFRENTGMTPSAYRKQ